MPHNRFRARALEEHPDASKSKLKRLEKLYHEEMVTLRNALYYEQAGHCPGCGNWIPKSLATFEHIIPWSLGGPETWGNGLMLCRTCNHKKGDKIPADLRVTITRPSLDYETYSVVNS